MKSLIRKPDKRFTPAKADRKVQLKVESRKVAQCCAKVSKAVAGCHD